MKKRLLFIINPNAGKGGIKGDLFDIILTFSKAGYEIITYMTTGPEDAERKVIDDGADYDLIVCAGGDGTLDNTVCGYMKMGDKKTPIGYIPVGTTNDFARSLKISRKPCEAATQIVNGELSKIDVGCMDGKYFIYIAAFGVFTGVSYSTKQSLKKVMGHSAYVVEAIKNIANIKSYAIEADFDGKTVTGEYIFGMFSNTFSVGGFKVRGTKYVVLDDGKFDCLLIKKPQNPAELQQIISAALLNDFSDDNLFFKHTASIAKIKCSKPIPWTLDGEFGGNLYNTEIKVAQKALTMCVDRSYVMGFSNDNIITEMAVSLDEEFDEYYEEETDAWD